VTPDQFTPERIHCDDVQRLLRRVSVKPLPQMSAGFPLLMPSHITITLRDGQTFAIEQDDYEGFLTRPMPWEHVVAKFNRLAAPFTERPVRDEIVEAVANLESIPVAELMRRLARVGGHTSPTKQANAGPAPTQRKRTAPSRTATARSGQERKS
jgi:2-methylcitrate dehydratase